MSTALSTVMSVRPRSRRFRGLAPAALALSLCLGSPAGAVKLEVKKDVWLDLHLLLQPWLVVRNDAKAERHVSGDFYLRRARIVLAGQVTRWLSFFAETDQPNWGKGGAWDSPGLFVQDAYLSLDLHESLRVVAGLLITPFVHQATQGATSLHTLDYHLDLIKYPNGSNKVWRDTGVMVRGHLFRKRLDYRVSMTRGVQDGFEVTKATATSPAVVSATASVPRFSGRVALNLFDAEEGFFLAGTYHGDKKLLSFGFAWDAQPSVYGGGAPYYALGGDVFVDLPLGRSRRLSGQLDVVHYGGSESPDRGVGLLFDLGVAFGRWEPLVALDWYRGAGAGAFVDHVFGLHAGLNYWFIGHTVNFKLDLGFVKPPARELLRANTVGTLQAHLYF